MPCTRQAAHGPRRPTPPRAEAASAAPRAERTGRNRPTSSAARRPAPRAPPHQRHTHTVSLASSAPAGAGQRRGANTGHAIHLSTTTTSASTTPMVEVDVPPPPPSSRTGLILRTPTELSAPMRATPYRPTIDQQLSTIRLSCAPYRKGPLTIDAQQLADHLAKECSGQVFSVGQKFPFGLLGEVQIWAENSTHYPFSPPAEFTKKTKIQISPLDF